MIYNRKIWYYLIDTSLSFMCQDMNNDSANRSSPYVQLPYGAKPKLPKQTLERAYFTT